MVFYAVLCLCSYKKSQIDFFFCPLSMWEKIASVSVAYLGPNDSLEGVLG